ncbi:FecR family protein [Deinococcus rubellus]|uniref:FecR family protein n=1 Tax=Deinococcus rubellus TaxID=1889240 RepID=A0ABY5YD77_9DEIO|nr:FecR family protein [Deinococcus rubellus]UWX63017.1 FecR family protein [Deinococcus rubellus]
MRLSIFLLCDLVCGLALTLGVAGAAPSVLREVSGSVEQRRTVWQAAAVGETVVQALRIGAGRATLQSGSGQLLAASGSALRIYQNEPDLQTGKFYLSGQLSFFSQSAHLASDGRVRLDLRPPTRRVAVISGTARLAVGTRIITLQASQQYDFATKQVTPFAERDAWYDSRFVGEGEAVVQSVKGPVTLGPLASAQPGSPSATPMHNAAVDERLQMGQQLLTGANAFTEVGFTGGGYLRLQPQSALSVLSIDQVLSEGGRRQREVTLQLTRGSAWNVVAKRQGGYEITTPTVTTAVRGTVFQVDEDGLVKVFEGQVALPSNAGLLLRQDEQRSSGGTVKPLVPDASDLANQALDRQRAAPTRLDLSLAPAASELSLTVRSQPDTQLSVNVAGRDLTVPGNAEGVFTLAMRPNSLPEGRYDLTVTARRPGNSASLRRSVLIDRSPPVLSGVQVTRLGRTAHLTGQVADLSPSVLLRAEVGGQIYTHTLFLPQQTTFDWLLPLPEPGTVIKLSATDAAGNAGTPVVYDAP